jgi:hypothetical protein
MFWFAHAQHYCIFVCACAALLFAHAQLYMFSFVVHALFYCFDVCMHSTTLFLSRMHSTTLFLSRMGSSILFVCACAVLSCCVQQERKRGQESRRSWDRKSEGCWSKWGRCTFPPVPLFNPRQRWQDDPFRLSPAAGERRRRR